MKYSMTIVTVADPMATAEFYKKAFGFPIGVRSKDGSYVDILTPEHTIGFVKEGHFDKMYGLKTMKARPNLPPGPISLTFSSSDVDADYKKAVQNGAKVIAPPHKVEWTDKLAYLSDPNGIIVSLSGPPSKDMMKNIEVINK